MVDGCRDGPERIGGFQTRNQKNIVQLLEENTYLGPHALCTIYYYVLSIHIYIHTQYVLYTILCTTRISWCWVPIEVPLNTSWRAPALSSAVVRPRHSSRCPRRCTSVATTERTWPGSLTPQSSPYYRDVYVYAY